MATYMAIHKTMVGWGVIHGTTIDMNNSYLSFGCSCLLCVMHFPSSSRLTPVLRWTAVAVPSEGNMKRAHVHMRGV